MIRDRPRTGVDLLDQGVVGNAIPGPGGQAYISTMENHPQPAGQAMTAADTEAA